MGTNHCIVVILIYRYVHKENLILMSLLGTLAYLQSHKGKIITNVVIILPLWSAIALTRERVRVTSVFETTNH